MTRKRTRPLRLVPKPPRFTEPSEAEALRHLKLLGGPVWALRALGGVDGNGRTLWPLEGYFDDPELAAHEAVALSVRGYDAVYVVLNRVDPECLYRSVNAFGPHQRGKSKGVAAVADKDIIATTLLFLDFDPQRTSGVSASEEEMRAALARAAECRAWLTGLGWPEPLYALGSGNGAHLAYRISSRDPGATAQLVKQLLGVLAVRFSDARVHVDEKVFNPGRIAKLAGTFARKGDDTADRPHRVAWLEDANPRTSAVRRPQLRELAESLEPGKGRHAPRRVTGGVTADALEAAMEARGLLPRRKVWQERVLLDCRCWREDHGNRSAFALLPEGGGCGKGEGEAPSRKGSAAESQPGGAGLSGLLLARCLHARCDASTANLLAFLGLEADTLPAAADELAAAAKKVNETGLTELWEEGALLYVVTHPERGDRLVKTAQAARTFLDDLPRVEGDDGPIHPFVAWSRSKEKRRAWGSVYLPEKPFGEILTGAHGDARLNRWQGFAYAPRRSVRGAKLAKSWWLSLEVHLCRGRKDVALWIRRLLAWKIQHPTRLPYTILVLTGEPGSGKNTFALPIVNLFGAHGLHTQVALGRFNARHQARAVIYHDEAEFLASPQVMRALKAASTEDEVDYEAKGVDPYGGKNMAMHILSSNDARVAVEPGDRRVLLLHTRAPSEGAAWFQSRGLDRVVGKADLEREASQDLHAQLLHDLLRVKLPKDWRPFPPPMTDEKREATREALPALEAWAIRTADSRTLPTQPVQTWTEGLELDVEDRRGLWVAYRASLKGRQKERALGVESFDGFARALLRLWGAAGRVRRRGKGTVRVWTLPSAETAAQCALEQMVPEPVERKGRRKR